MPVRGSSLSLPCTSPFEVENGGNGFLKPEWPVQAVVHVADWLSHTDANKRQKLPFV